ncbi:MAG: hypothetical protein KDD25_07890 [Bdellovibrionales bacterium]|nr:hypothetical protein [Bdellovibrionales bacterium]
MATLSRAIVLVFIITNTVSVFADGERDLFSEISKLYDEGTEVTFAELEGWTSGRCYGSSERDLPYASLLVGMTRKVSGNGGPLFPPVFSSRIFPLLLPTSYKGDTFDNLGRMTLDGFIDELNKAFYTFEEFRYENGTLVAPIEQGNGEIKIRKNGTNLVVLAFATRDIVDTDIKSGDLVTSCYYFKKIN